MTASFCISWEQSFEAPGQTGAFSTYYPKGQTETILSISPTGERETRPADQAGNAWETWRPSKDGNRAIFHATVEVYAFPLVD
jgi:Tol biopolymer transport system component